MKKMLIVFSVVVLGVLTVFGQHDENTQRAIKAFEKEQWEEGFRLTKDADRNDKTIQFYLGVMYDKGWGVTKDYSEAVKWFRKAAEQGDANAKKALKRLGY